MGLISLYNEVKKAEKNYVSAVDNFKKYVSSIESTKIDILPIEQAEVKMYCSKLGITYEELISKSRIERIRVRRQVIAYVLEQKYGCSQTARLLDMHHSSIIHSKSVIEKAIEVKNSYELELSLLETLKNWES